MLALDNVLAVQGGFELKADFRVPAGARVTVIGPSGAGKSTLLSAIAGFTELRGGSISIDGADVTALPPGERPLSMLFQDNNLFPHLTVAQNVSLGVRPSLRLRADETEEVLALLERSGLAGLESRMPATLSGGQRGRVALARALIRKKPLLLLDEPFSALNPGLRHDLLDFVGERVGESGATLLLVSHDPADAMRMGGETALVDNGAVSPPQDTARLFKSPPESLKRHLGI